MGYVWYADVYFLNGFLLDAAGLLAAAACCNRPLKIRRMLAASAVSVTAGMILYIYLPNYLSYCLAIHLAVNPLTTAAAFFPGTVREFIRLHLTVCLVLFFVGGVQECLFFGSGISGAGQVLFCGLLAAAALAAYLLRRRIMGNVCVVDLWLRDRKVTVSAYCDSGNLLRDPKNGKPVSIVQQQAIPDWNPGNCHADKIQYRTISDPHSCMDVITLDKMDIYLKGTKKQIRHPEIGLRDGSVMRRPPVQMLLHSAYLE